MARNVPLRCTNIGINILKIFLHSKKIKKTKKIKNKEIDVVSKNPHTQIMGVEYIQIKK